MGVLGEMFPSRKLRSEAGEAGSGQGWRLGHIDLDAGVVEVHRGEPEPDEDGDEPDPDGPPPPLPSTSAPSSTWVPTSRWARPRDSSCLRRRRPGRVGRHRQDPRETHETGSPRAGQWSHERAHRPSTAGAVRHPADRRLVPPRQLPRRGPAVGGPAGRPRRVLLHPGPARDHRRARPEDSRRAHAQRRGPAARARARPRPVHGLRPVDTCPSTRSWSGCSAASRGSARRAG